MQSFRPDSSASRTLLLRPSGPMRLVDQPRQNVASAFLGYVRTGWKMDLLPRLNNPSRLRDGDRHKAKDRNLQTPWLYQEL